MISKEPPDHDMLKASGLTDGSPSSVEKSNRCRILLGELIHLVGLFLIHARQSKGERAANVLFDQMVRHLKILEDMPGHDGGILIRRADCRGDAAPSRPDYMVFFGNMILQGAKESIVDGAGDSRHLHRALTQAFGYFWDQGIHALYIQLPGDSREKTERLRLSLNIVSRYHYAAQKGGSITLRHNQRTLTIPLIADSRGLPDPNLTLMAALNGLSAVNARSLIAQANAFQAMSRTSTGADGVRESCVSSYNRIFRVRSLRSQIVKPPVEVNNLPWLEDLQPPDEDVACQAKPDAAKDIEAWEGQNVSPPGIVVMPLEVPIPDPGSQIEPADLAPYVDLEKQEIRAAVQVLWAQDDAGLEPLDLGRRLVALTQLLYAIEKKCQDMAVIDAVLDLLRQRMQHVPDAILTCMEARRQGIKINVPERAVLVGLVHPRLFDLILLLKERIVAQQRIAVVREMAFDFDLCHINALADGFGLSKSDAHHILKLLPDCFGADGTFIRPAFEARAKIMAQHENAIFEILWCFLKETFRREDRLNFLNAFQLIIARLSHPRQALQFLLADICQVPTGISYTDRNALALSNILLHMENKELHVDISRTPDDVLIKRRALNPDVKHYAAWRLEIDQVRYGTKLRTIHQAVQRGVCRPRDKGLGGFQAPFLLALEREAFMFSALVGGHTARTLLREALDTYGNPHAKIFDRRLGKRYLARLVDQLQVVVRCLGRAGHWADIHKLNALVKSAGKLMGLDAHPAHRLRVKQVMEYAVKACRTIASRGR